MFIFDKIVKYLEPRDVFNASMQMHEDEWCLPVTYQAVCALRGRSLTDSVLYSSDIPSCVCFAQPQPDRQCVVHDMIGVGTKFQITKFLSNST
jgi:hypothetical protein